MLTRKGIKLRTVIGLLVAGTVLLTAAVISFFSISTDREMLAESYLDSNYQYAKKVASNTTELLQSMRSSLEIIAELAGQTDYSMDELDVWFTANRIHFNSMFIVDEDRIIQKATANINGMKTGEKLNSQAAIDASRAENFYLSPPYNGLSGKLIILAAAPIVNTEGDYKGFVGGTLYLEEDNSLSRSLSRHYYDNGSYVYVTDREGYLIYHPDPSRLHEIVLNNDVVKKALAGKSGKQQVVNTRGGTYLAGYSFEPESGWAIVSQTPIEVMERPLKKALQKQMLQYASILVMVMIIAFLVSYIVAKPLYKLARFAEETSKADQKWFRSVPIVPSGIYEVKQLYQSLAKHLELLNKEITHDGLTGLYNRKTFNDRLVQYIQDDLPFSIAMIDIDRFKAVNDTYGHQIGDDVLKFLAVQLKLCVEDWHECFRYGGEEFVVLIPGDSIADAAAYAERFRLHMESTISPTGLPVHVSIGLAHSNMAIGNSRAVIDLADKALYQSKEQGRNRVTISQK